MQKQRASESERQSELNLKKTAMCILLYPIFGSFRVWITEYSQWKDSMNFIPLPVSKFVNIPRT